MEKAGGLYEFDPEKAALNLAKHGVSFDAARLFDWTTARHFFDRAHSAAELRYRSIGFIEGRLHVMVWTPRGERVRIIGLRKANSREKMKYDSEKS